MRNILLKDITIIDPRQSPGVILGNATFPTIVNVTFDNVVVVNPGEKPWGPNFYDCAGVSNGRAIGNTYPVPPCFQN
jgi:hypothetical protein